MTTHQRCEDRHVVRVRLRPHAYSSPVMTAAEAAAVRDALLAAIERAAPDHGFVMFDDRRHREVAIRARDVYAIEIGTPFDDEDQRMRQPAPSTGTGVVVGGTVPVTGGVPAPATGTEFLRSVGGHPVRVPR